MKALCYCCGCKISLCEVLLPVRKIFIMFIQCVVVSKSLLAARMGRRNNGMVCACIISQLWLQSPNSATK